MKITLKAALLCLAVLLAGAGCSKKPAASSVPLTDYEMMRLQVAKEVQAGTIKLDPSGSADLPEAEQIASTDGKIYALNNGDKGWLVAFNLTFGQTAKQQFLLHAEKSTLANNEAVSVGPLKLIVTGKAGPDWYNAITP